VIEKLKTAAEVLLLATIAGFVGGTALIVCVELFSSTTTTPRETFYSSFWGAFLAFVFVRTSDALNRMYDAARAGRKALGHVQFTLNEAMSITNDNIFVMQNWRQFVRNLESAKSTGTVLLFGNTLKAVPGTKEFLIDVTSNGLANELFLLESSIRKLNDSMETWQRAYLDAKDALMSQNINPATYLLNVETANRQAGDLEKFMRALIDEVMDALTATRLLLKPKPFLVKVFNWLNPDGYLQPSDQARKQERVRLQREAEEISKESRARITAVTGAPTVGKIDGH
jgi:hypothetical protein